MTTEMNMNGQAVGNVASLAVQTATDLAKAGKEAARAQGEAFQKAS